MITYRNLEMKTVRTLLAMGLLVLTSLASAFTYQGELSQTGTSFDGTADLQFSLFDAQIGGDQIGLDDLHSNVVINGSGSSTARTCGWKSPYRHRPAAHW